MLLSHLLKVKKEYLLIHDEDEIEENIKKDFFEKINRLAKNEPIQYVINSAEFMGLEFYVDNNVLIPQPDTEILVQKVIEICKKIRGNKENLLNVEGKKISDRSLVDIDRETNFNKTINIKEELKILDLCTGSGAIGVSIAKNIENSQIVATDISAEALKIAKLNANKNNVNLKFIKSDLFENIGEKFDIIVSNPPYIETEIIEKLSEEVKQEPLIALDGGKDGLEFYRKIAKNSRNYLVKEGVILLEIGYNQKESVIEILKSNGFENIEGIKDLGNRDRVIIAYCK